MPGIVRREVTRVVTPGMVLDDQMLDPARPATTWERWCWLRRRAVAGSALLDASTGELRLGRAGSDERLVGRAGRARSPRELLVARGDVPRHRRRWRWLRAVGAPLAERERRATSSGQRRSFGAGWAWPRSTASAWADLAARARRRRPRALAYLEETQRRRAGARRPAARAMPTRRGARPRRGDASQPRAGADALGRQAKGSLLGLLDRSVTGPGGAAPAPSGCAGRSSTGGHRSPARRGGRAGRLGVLREELAGALRAVADLERLLSRLALGAGQRTRPAGARGVAHGPAAARGPARGRWRSAPARSRQRACGARGAGGAAGPGGGGGAACRPQGGRIHPARAFRGARSLVDLADGGQGHHCAARGGGAGRAPASARSRSATTGSSATTSRSPRPNLHLVPGRLRAAADDRGRRSASSRRR